MAPISSPASGKPFFRDTTTTRDQERLAPLYATSGAPDQREFGLSTQHQFERRRIGFDFDMMEYRWSIAFAR